MELMAALFLMVLINILVTLGRQTHKRGIRYLYMGISAVLLLMTLLLLIRMLLK